MILGLVWNVLNIMFMIMTACSPMTMNAHLKPFVIFGQVEPTLNEFSFGSKQWVRPSEERSILPKSTGMGLMISGFLIRDCLFCLLPIIVCQSGMSLFRTFQIIQ